MRGGVLALLGLGGAVACFGSLALLMLGPGMLADARTPDLTGPGVSVWLVDRYVAPGDSMRIEVEAHGGSAAGIERVVVWTGGHAIASTRGEGRDWGTTVTSRSRGAETVELSFDVPRDARPGEPIELEVEVESIAAMANGVGTFTNDRFHHRVPLVITPRVGVDALVARALAMLGALSALALWTGLLVAASEVVRRYEPPGGDPQLGQILGSAAIGIGIGATVLGYWLFARPFAAAVWLVASGPPPGLDYTMIAAWLGVPAWVVWRRARAYVPTRRYTLHVTSTTTKTKDGYRAREDVKLDVPLDTAGEALVAAGWTLGRRRAGRVRATKGTSRIEVRGSDLVSAPSELEIDATDAVGPLEVAKRLAETFGPLRVRGPALDEVVAHDANVDAVLRRQLEATLALAREIVARSKR